MIRVIISGLVLAMFIVACGPKTGSKITVDPAQAKAKYGSNYNSDELGKLAEADKIKTEADALAAAAEEDFASAKELMDKAAKQEAPEKKQWYEQRAEKAFLKGYEKKIQASEKYAQSNRLAFNATKSASERYKSKAPEYVLIAAEEAEMNAESLMKEATDLRKQAAQEKDHKTKYQLLSQADELEALAIDAQKTVFDIYTGVQKVPEPEVKKDPIPDPIEKKEPEVIKPSPKKIVYKVQIAASRTELPLEKLTEIYAPKPEEIINNNIEDGWYKYAVGKFPTYAEAQAYKDNMGVPGAFIIAYKEDEKILLPEIEEKIKRGEMEDPRKNLSPISQSDVIYMVQIAATKIPARPSQVQQMYHGQQIVSIRQSRGWYKYTVGNFDSREKAEEFLERTGVEGSFVVAFDKRGKEIILDR